MSNIHVELKTAALTVKAAETRAHMLAQHGLQECEACGSWIRKTRAAELFHFRRCSG